MLLVVADMAFLQKKLTRLLYQQIIDKKIICENKINALSYGHFQS